MQSDTKNSTSDDELLAQVTELLESDELTQLMSYTQHGTTTTYDHCVDVAARALAISNRLKLEVDKGALIRGALLHDYYLYDWHESPHGWKHSYLHQHLAAQNARRDFGISDLEYDIISCHMFPIGLKAPKSVEGTLVCLADKVSTVSEVAGGILERIRHGY